MESVSNRVNHQNRKFKQEIKSIHITTVMKSIVMAVVGLQIVREGEGAIARVSSAEGGRPRGFAHGLQERRDFLLISCLIRLIHLLSLYRGLLDP